MTDRVVKVSVVAEVNSYLTGMAKVEKATRDSRTEAEQLGARLEQQRRTFTIAGASMLAASGVIAAGLAIATKKAADFDAQMASVKTLSGATAGEMNSLRDAALHLGQGIGLSATSVADAETELVKAGISVKDQLGGALKGTLDLAAAGQLNVADATSIAAAAMTQFKLAGKDVPHIADLLAAGADKALGSVSDLGAGLKFIGPVAQSMGISIEQTVGALSLLAQNGILGTEAGTSLRGVLLSLTSPSRLAQKTLEEYGITLYDAKGKFIGLAGVAEQLKTHLGGLNQATRNQALGQIFGNQQITAATILMQGGAKEVDKWTTAVNDSGFAAHQAAGKMDSLKGDISKLSAAWDSALIGIGESGQGPLRGLTQGVTGVLTQFNNLPEPAKNAAFVIGGVTTAVTVAGGAFFLAIPKVVAFKAAVADSGAIVQGTTRALGGLTRALTVAGVAATAVTGVDALADAISKNLLPSAEQIDNQMRHAKSGVELFNTALNKEGINNVQQSADMLHNLGKELDAVAKSDFFHPADTSSTASAVASQLAAIANSGDMASFSAQFRRLGEDAHLTDKEMRTYISDNPDLQNALTSQATAAGISATKTNLLKIAMGDSVKAQGDSMSAAKEAAAAYQEQAGKVDDLNGKLATLLDSINKANGVGQDAVTKNDSYQNAIAKVDDTIQKAKDHQKGYALTLDTGTQAGRDNTDMLVEMAQKSQDAAKAQFDLDGNTDKYRATLEAGRQSLIDHAQKLGDNAGQAKDLADKIYSIPSDTEWHMIADTSVAAQEIDAFINDTQKKFMKLGTLNVTKSGQFGIVYQNGPNAPKFNADGGLYESHAAEIAPAGAWRVWAEPETGGEAYIPLAAAKRARSEWILSRTAEMFGGRYVRGFADGGFTRPVYAQAPMYAPVAASGGTNVSQTTNVFPTPGMSEEQVARIAAEKTGFILKGLG